MGSEPSSEESIASLVGMVILAFLFAIMLPVMLFMYIDMQTLRLENQRIESKVVKYRDLIERCDR